MVEEKNNYEGLMTDSSDYINTNIIALRLSTDPILQKLELYLKGAVEVVEQDEEGVPRVTYHRISKPKANNEGIHGIMGWVQSLLNSQVVQGNTQSFDHLSNYLVDLRLDMSEHFMKNRVEWGIELNDFEGIIDMIMAQLRMFLSRTVGDGERRSYANTIKQVETNTNKVENTKKIFPFMN